jgi:hypothetical protein
MAVCLPLLRDTLQEICNSLDSRSAHDLSLTITFLHLLKRIVIILRDHLFFEEKKEDRRRRDTVQPLCHKSNPFNKEEELKKKVDRPFHELLEEDERKGKDAEEAVMDEELEAEKLKETDHEKRRRHVQEMAEMILTRCQHYLSYRNREVKITVQDTIHAGLQVLSIGSDEARLGNGNGGGGGGGSKLYPMVHVIWQPLVSRLGDSDSVVVIKTLETITSIGNLAKSFISTKFADDAWPFLRVLLGTNNANERAVVRVQEEGEEAEVGSPRSSSAKNKYQFSASFKTQRAALGCLVQLCEYVAKAVGVEVLIRHCAPFLSDLKLTQLQRLATQLFKVLIRLSLLHLLPSQARDRLYECLFQLAATTPKEATTSFVPFFSEREFTKLSLQTCTRNARPLWHSFQEEEEEEGKSL